MKQVDWKKIDHFEAYEISNTGVIRSYLGGCRYAPRSKRLSPKILKPWKDKDGYLHVTLRNSFGSTEKRKVHHLVLESFLGKRGPGQQCAHLNGKKEDNQIWNLAWTTCLENSSHKILHGTDLRGSKSPCAK